MAQPTVFGLWTDNLVPAATLTFSTGADATAGRTALTDGNPAKPFAFGGTSGHLDLDNGSARKAALVALFSHNLQVGYTAAFQADSAATFNSGGGGSPIFSSNRVTGATEEDGYKPDVYWDNDAGGGAPTLRYHRVNFASANAVAIQLGNLFIGPVRRTFPRGFQIGASYGTEVDVIRQTTWGGVEHAINKGFRREVLSGQVAGTEAECDTHLSYFRALGGPAQPIVLIPDASKPDVYLCKIDQSSIRKRVIDGGVFAVTLQFRRLSRGLFFTY